MEKTHAAPTPTTILRQPKKIENPPSGEMLIFKSSLESV
jgi:hypothetical protein